MRGEERLLLIAKLHIHASHFYLDAGMLQQHVLANKIVALFMLQLKAVQLHLAASLTEVTDDENVAMDNSNSNTVSASTTGLTNNHEGATAHNVDVGKSKQVTSERNLGSVGDRFVLINLTEEQVMTFGEYHNDFVAAFTVVSAYEIQYGKGVHDVWSTALYRNVVVNLNLDYLLVFMQNLELTDQIALAVCECFVSEYASMNANSTTCATRISNLKTFLNEGLSNLEIRLHLARLVSSACDDFAQVSKELEGLVYM